MLKIGLDPRMAMGPEEFLAAAWRLLLMLSTVDARWLFETRLFLRRKRP